MSGIFGVFTLHGEPTTRATVQRMLSALRARGGDSSSVWEDEGVCLGVSRYEWERDARFSGDAMVVRDGELVIVADASLYYRADLLAMLAASGLAPQMPAPTPSHLILAAYRAWGASCLQHLEGDFAFILWDAQNRRVCCGRDFAGSRPLFYADLNGTLLVASSVGALQMHPLCPDDFNLPFLAETAANVWLPAHDTAY